MNVINKISFALQMLLILPVFISNFQKRKNYTLKLIAGITMIILFSEMWEANTWWLSINLLFRYTIIMILFFVLIDICYAEAWNVKLFALTAAYSVQTIIYGIYSVLCYLMELILPNTRGTVTEPVIFVMITAAGLIASIRIFPRRMNELQNNNVENRIMILLTVCIILVSNLFNVLMIQVDIPDYAYSLFFTPMRMIPCILLLCLQFNLLNNQSLKMERNILERLLKEKDIQYQVSKENIELIQLKCHDIKYQIKALQNSSNIVKTDALKEIENSIDIYDGIVKTGNEALDVILTEKSLFCENHKIKITVMLDGEKLNYIDVSDLYCIFGNAIDNAIEAVEQEDDEEKRLISITSKQVGNLFSIRMANYCSGEIQFENGMPVTSKEDKQYHGFGLKSISYIVEKYNGSISIHKENSLFVLNILFPLK